MMRLSAAVLTAGLFLAAPALAVDGHGNASNPSVSVPNTGTVSGGTLHRDDSATKPVKDGKDGKSKSSHAADDGHGHGKK